MAQPIVNPELPFVGEVPSGLQPGKMIRFQGVTHPNSDRFNINLATGPNAKPRDDTALHLSVRLNQGYIARNTYRDGSWGDEQGSGTLPIGQAQSFEILILVDPHHYKIAVNGQHFCEFPHRIPYDKVTHLLIDGDVSLTLISFEGIVIPGNESATQASQVNAEFGGPQYGPPPSAPQYGPPPGAYGPPPGAYGPPPPNYGGYGPPPPGAQPQSEMGGFFEQAQDILANAIKSAATEKILGSILHSGGQAQQQNQGFAHQNAKYGIYPDLPTQDTTTTQTPTQNTGNAKDPSALSNLIASSGGTITSGPQPQSATEGPHNPGPVEGLLMGLLGGKSDHQAQGTEPGQSSGADMLSGFLSSLLNVNTMNQQAGGQEATQPQQQSQGGGSDVLSNILQSLTSGNTGSETQVSPNQTTQSQGSEVLSNILSSLLTSNQNQQASQNVAQNAPQSQGQGGSDVLASILQNLVSGSKQEQQSSTSGNVQNVPSHGSEQTGVNNAEMLGSLLQGLWLKAQQQHDSTRPIQETRPAGGAQDSGAAPGSQQQYGQYPHAPQQEQKGPVESLLSGLLSGGGQQQQQPESAAGLGGILGSLAGSFLNRPNQH